MEFPSETSEFSERNLSPHDLLRWWCVRRRSIRAQADICRSDLRSGFFGRGYIERVAAEAFLEEDKIIVEVLLLVRRQYGVDLLQRFVIYDLDLGLNLLL
jgi:hypothetical protein